MSYTTETIVRKRSPFKDLTNIGTVYVNNKIDEADSVINSMIGSIYQLPLSETPDMIREASTVLTMFKLIEDQNLNLEIANGVNVTDAIDNVMEMLDMIRKRKLKLYDSNFDELTVNDLLKPSFYPTQASSDAGVTPPVFEMNKKF